MRRESVIGAGVPSLARGSIVARARPSTVRAGCARQPAGAARRPGQFEMEDAG